MKEYNKQYNEILALYSLESKFNDYYVEGPNDKMVFENYIESRDVDATVIEIDNVNFDEFGENYGNLDLKSNKHKLILLSRGLTNEKIDSNIACIVDKDFDGILEPIEENRHLLRTDYSCLESYFFNERFLKKVLDNGITNFPFEPELVLDQLSKILRKLFLIRLVRITFKINSKLPRLDNAVCVVRKSGVIEFDFDKYLMVFLNQNKMSHMKTDVDNFIADIVKVLHNDSRNCMNGHDFVELLFLYVNKIKNTQNFKKDSFERLLYCSIQPEFFDDYNLFQILKNR